jgi:gluconokinase
MSGGSAPSPTAAPSPADGPLALAIDVGTSAVRAFLYDSAGTGISGVRLRYEWTTTTDGGAEMDAERLVALVVEAMEGALTRAGPLAARIAAVGMTGMWHTLIAVGADDRPLTPLYAWSDTRASSAAASLRTSLDETAFHARTGTVFHPSYMPARVRWLRQLMPDVARGVRRWMTIGDYLMLRLFGSADISISLASGTGLLDQHRVGWDAPLLEALEVDAGALPTIIDLEQTRRGMRAEFADRVPELRDVPFVSALGDGACANVGSGCVRPDALALSIGSSAALRVIARVDDFSIPVGLWCYRLDRSNIVLGGALSNGGNVYAWLRDMLRLPSHEEVELALVAGAPDAHALTVIPFLAGERSPDWSLTARAAVAGLRLDTGPIDLLRASMEAVALRLALIQGLLRAYFPTLSTIMGSGGALRRSPAWAQIVTDALGHPLAITEDHETSSRGAALLALQAVGAIPDAGAIPPPGSTVLTPNAERTMIYARALARQTALARAISAWERDISPQRSDAATD